MEERIQKFRVDAQVAIWEFLGTKSYGDFGLSVSDKPESFVALLDLMNESEWPSKKQFSAVVPNDEWIVNTGDIRAFDEIEISLRKEAEDLFDVITESKIIRLQFGQKSFQTFRHMVATRAFDVGMKDGRGRLLMFW